jgi:hypothetical protein
MSGIQHMRLAPEWRPRTYTSKKGALPGPILMKEKVGKHCF